MTDVSEDFRPADLRGVCRLPPEVRDRRATVLAARMDAPMAALGVIFLLVVLGQTLATGPELQAVLAGLSWALWVVFVGEFLVRWYIAADRRRFLRRNWWQVLFLVVPVLRLFRLAAVLRLAKAGRVVSSAVRSSRSAGRIVRSRLAWLVAVTAIVILTSSQLLYAFGLFDRYGDALHAAALATVTGQSLEKDEGPAQVLDVVLAVYSVGVFAAIAAALGAYFLEGRQEAAAGRS